MSIKHNIQENIKMKEGLNRMEGMNRMEGILRRQYCVWHLKE